MAPTAWLAKVRLVGERLATGRRARAGEAHGLGAAGGVVGEGDGGGASSTRGGRKGHADRAVGSCRYACPAIIGLGKVAGIGARERDAGDAQGRVAGIVQGYGLSRAGGADGLAGESEAGGGKTDGGTPCPCR